MLVGRLLLVVMTVAAACAPPGDDGRSGDGGGVFGSPPEATSPLSLEARPDPDVQGDARTGLIKTDASGPGSLVYVPKSYRPGAPAPFALTLHGCCGEARAGLNLWRAHADQQGVILLAPDGGGSWGTDAIDRLDSGLTWVFQRYAVDPDHVAVVGFSAGASFALTLGLANGDLFTHVVAHSPGGLSAPIREGKPKIFVIHGTQDQTISIEQSSRQLVPELRNDGYGVKYVEYNAGHKPQRNLLRRTVRWFTR